MEQERPWLVPFLQKLSLRPLEVLGSEDVRALAVFLEAYTSIRRDAGLSPYPTRDAELLDGFHAWLARRYPLPHQNVWELVERIDGSAYNVWTFLDAFEMYLRGCQAGIRETSMAV